ncbi:MAG: hypothetical protein V6Z86_06470 [Hyphomicrobiales bacterium]
MIRMRFSLFLSLVLHAAILITMVIAVPPSHFQISENSAPIPVEFVKSGKATQITDLQKQLEKLPRPEQKPESPEPKAVQKSKATARIRKMLSRATQAKKSFLKKDIDQKSDFSVNLKSSKRPAKSAEPKPLPHAVSSKAVRPVPKPLARPKRPIQSAKKAPKKAPATFNPDEIAALLNKLPDQPKTLSETGESKTEAAREPNHETVNDDKSVITVNELEGLKRQIGRCWAPPSGLTVTPDLVVRLRVRMEPDGSVSRLPDVLNTDPAPQFPAAASAAVAAVMACQPYDMPREKYAFWHEMILNFDPSHMYGN